MKRSLVKAGSGAPALIFALICALPIASLAASAKSGPAMSFWYAGTRLAFDRPQIRASALAVGIDDPGLGRFLLKLNATVSHQAGQKYVIFATGDRRTVSFALGDPSVTVDGTPQAAAFAPYEVRGTVFVPFIDLARTLGVVPVMDGATTVLQPQIGDIDVKTENGISLVTIRGASTLQFKRLSDPTDDRLSLAFIAIGSPLDRDRPVTSPGLRAISVTVGGSVKSPLTVLNFDGAAGGTHVLVPNASPNTIEVAFAPSGVALDGTTIPAVGSAKSASAPLAVRDSNAPPPSPPPAPFRGAVVPGASPAAIAAAPNAVLPPVPGTLSTDAPTAETLAPATITGVTTNATDTGFDLHLAISGPVTYEWHRLADFRWYVDFKPATLAIAPQDSVVASQAVLSLRVKPFVGPNDKLSTVRVGLTLPSPRTVALVPTPGGLTISVGNVDDVDPQITSSGELANGALLASVPLPPPPIPTESIPPAWKFGEGETTARNPRLIVIDAGHGGSDAGSVHLGLTEKDLTLDISRRLRTALIARGWQVKMTRDSDIDVYKPNDSGVEELQARDDVANTAGARFLISVHTNAFTSSSLNGTTMYYYKSDSLGLATAVHGRLARELPTADDGIRKENFYVIHHTDMPSILIEVAFDSNPGDAALLRTDAFKNQVAKSIAAGVGDYARPGGATSNLPVMDGQ